MAFDLPPLPYEKDALAPAISRETMEYHYGKHHAGYVDKLNNAVDGSDLADKSLEEVIHHAAKAGDSGIFNNAAQVWNHDFFWKSMSPDGGGSPDGALARAIDDAFGGLDGFKEKFLSAATGQFGSGWAWLVENKGQLEIVATQNAETPLTGEAKPILCCDVWEHAYYLDYQNDRKSFVETFLDKPINWDFAAERFALEGEGNYAAAAEYRAGQEAFAADDQRVAEKAREAADAVSGADADALEDARQRAAAGRR